MEINIDFDTLIPDDSIVSNIKFNILKEYLYSNYQNIYKTIDLLYIFQSSIDQIELNKSYLNHDYDTDIITFNYSENNSEIKGEMYLSINQIEKNAIDYNETLQEELNRVLIHGVLHLIGFNDKTKEEADLMKLEEDKFINYTKKFHVEQ